MKKTSKNHRYLALILLGFGVLFSLPAEAQKKDCKNCLREEEAKTGDMGAIRDSELAELQATLKRVKNNSLRLDNDNRFLKINLGELYRTFFNGRKTSGNNIGDGERRFTNNLEFHGTNAVTSHVTSGEVGSLLEKNLDKAGKISGSLSDKQKGDDSKCSDLEDDQKTICYYGARHGARSAEIIKQAFKNCETQLKDKDKATRCKEFVQRFELSPNLTANYPVHSIDPKNLKETATHRIMELTPEAKQAAEEAGVKYGDQVLKDANIGKKIDPKGEYYPNWDLVREDQGALVAQEIKRAEKNAMMFSAQKIARQLYVDSEKSETFNNLQVTDLLEKENAKKEITKRILDNWAEKIKDEEGLDKKEKQARRSKLESQYAADIEKCLSIEAYCRFTKGEDKKFTVKDYADGGDVGAGFEDVREYTNKQYVAGVKRPLLEFKQMFEGNSDLNERTDQQTQTKPYKIFMDSVDEAIDMARDLSEGIPGELVDADGNRVRYRGFGGKDWEELDPSRASYVDLFKRRRDETGRVIGSTLNTGYGKILFGDRGTTEEDPENELANGRKIQEPFAPAVRGAE